MPTLAVIGAGPGLGLAIARAFGTNGFNVALVSRDRSKLDRLVDQLRGDGVTAGAFPADVLDHDALAKALAGATAHFGTIDVLEYSPLDTGATKLATPSEVTPADLQQQIDLQLYGAVAATQAVLPAMRDAGAGTLLFTTGAGSIDPVPAVGNVNAAAAALRNWAVNLHKELAGTGVYAAHVGIDAVIGTSVDPVIAGFPSLPADEVAKAYWNLYTTRDGAEFIVTSDMPK
jgi:NADP-dependent 3-hydroxy acid dehydrogenase YdfG